MQLSLNYPAVRREQIPGLDNYIRDKAFSSAIRFESKKVSERVFESELARWWNSFLPGSRVLLVKRLLRDGLEKRTCTEPFIPTAQTVPIGIQREGSPFLLSGPYFLSTTLVSIIHSVTLPISSNTPNTPIPFDSRLVEYLLNLP